MSYRLPTDANGTNFFGKKTPDNNDAFMPTVIYGPDGKTPISSVNPLATEIVSSADNPVYTQQTGSIVEEVSIDFEDFPAETTKSSYYKVPSGCKYLVVRARCYSGEINSIGAVLTTNGAVAWSRFIKSAEVESLVDFPSENIITKKIEITTPYIRLDMESTSDSDIVWNAPAGDRGVRLIWLPN